MKLIYCISLTLFPYIAWSQAFLQLPIEGTEGKDWVIVNYVDWDSVAVYDHNCGSKSYEGHQGTDFTIRSFRQMDSGVAVLAAATGVVTFTVDTFYDRETSGELAKKLGNYIAIKHENDYYTYYGHLKKNSAVVSNGDTVSIGQKIAEIGSSGNSTDPHLHFELWYDSSYLVDPFHGNCGNNSSLFVNPPEYDTSLGIFEFGFANNNQLNLSLLRNRAHLKSAPYEFKASSDSALNFWAQLYGLRKGKELTTRWVNPNGVEWFNYSVTLDRDYWYYYYWTNISHSNLPAGEWTVRFYYDGNEIIATNFDILEELSLQKSKKEKECVRHQQRSLEELIRDKNIQLTIIRLDGQKVSLDEIQSGGVYIIEIQSDYHICRYKRWLD